METKPVAMTDERQTMETATLTNLPAARQGSDRILSMLSHLSALLGVGILLPLVVYLAMRKESESVAAHAREALNFHLSILIYSLCCLPLVLVFIGIPLLLVLWLGSFVFAVIATVQASNGVCYRYPLTLRLVS